MDSKRTLCLLGVAAVFTVILVSPLYAQPLNDWVRSETGSTNDSMSQTCPLTDPQKQQAVDAFQPLYRFMISEPRCVNCHGGVNPFISEREGHHAGGKMEIKMKTITTGGGGFPVETQVVPDVTATEAECQQCHSALPGWTVPTKDLFFVGKDAPTLCQQMKRERPGSTFVDHIAREAVGERQLPQFIAEAFKGTRGLGQSGIDFYEGDTGKSFQVEPPAGMTHEQLVQLAQKWVDTLAGANGADPACGCEPPQPQTGTGRLDFSVETTYEVQYTQGDLRIAGSATSRENVTGNWQLRIKPFQNNASQGVFTATNQIQVNADADLKGVWPSHGNWQHTFMLQLNGTGTSHNPAQPGDDAYGRHPTLLAGGRFGNLFQPAPAVPGTIRLYQQNGKSLYSINLPISQIAPTFSYQMHNEITSGTTRLSDETYDNASLLHAYTSNVEPAHSSKDSQPYLFGGIIPDRRVPNPETGTADWLSGAYDPKSGALKGDEEFNGSTCAEAQLFDPLGVGNFLQSTSGMGDEGVSFSLDGNGVTCHLHYTLRICP